MKLFRTIIVCWAVTVSISVAQSTADDVKALYSKQEVMIPMRDGVKLFTQIYAPRDTTRTYPILINRTPYSVRPYGADAYRSLVGPSILFQTEGYIVVYQDVRGKFKSEGTFDFMRPFEENKRTSKETDESSDVYDTIDWLLTHISGHNGRAGIWGISYPGYQAAMGMIDAHPALKAASPQAPMADVFVGDDFHHNGAYWLIHAAGWLWGTAPFRTSADALEKPVKADNPVNPDGYDFFLHEIGPLRNIDTRYFKGRVPDWNLFMKHGTYDEYWQARNILPHIRKITPAVMTVGGWFDSEDKYGAVNVYRSVERSSPGARNILVWGPWHHGGWARVDGDTLGHIRFGQKTSLWYREQVEFKFFQYHLKGIGTDDLPEITAFMTGANEWKQYDAWPPKESAPKNLYLREGGRLSFDAPTTTKAFDTYVSDPSKPVPFTMQTTMSMGHTYMVEDQRFASTRPDVLVYATEPLSDDVTIAGNPRVELIGATTGTDCDWMVKLIDVFPPDSPDNVPNPTGTRMGGFQMLVGGEALRGKFRTSLSHPEPIRANTPTTFSFDLPDKLHRFKKGHRIMVQIQSTWFPLVDRNPGKFMDIYSADSSDFRPTTQTVYRARTAASHLVLRILPNQ